MSMSNENNGKSKVGRHGDDGLQELANIWQQAPCEMPVPNAIRENIRRQERRIRMTALLEWAGSIAVGIGGVYLTLASEMRDAPWRALLVLVLLTWAMAFSVSNRRGVWDPLEESTRGYLDLARLRLERKRRMLRFTWILLIVELGIFAVWQGVSYFGWLEPIFTKDIGFVIGWLLTFTVGLGIWSVWYSRRIKKSEIQIDTWQQENFETTKNKL